MIIVTRIASTTHIDKYGERLSVEALEGMATKINREYIPYLINHDFDKQIGVLLYGKVKKNGRKRTCTLVCGEYF